MDDALVTRGLTRRFGDLTVVDSLDLRVPQGSIFAFLGPNGAGKTTTIRMLLGLIKPSAGQVTLLGSSSPKDRRRLLSKVGALVEGASLYPHLTGRENLEIIGKLRGGKAGEPREVARVLDLVDLTKDQNRVVRKYSGGMRQRLAIAQALLGEPELLVLDEPTNALDPAGIHEVRNLMRQLAQNSGATVFLSSHLLGEVEQVADQVGIIQEGKLLFQGSIDELNRRVETSAVVEVDDIERCCALLTAWGVLGFSKVGPATLTVPLSGRTEAAALNTRLVGAGIRVSGLTLAKPSLEELFLALTGTITTESEAAA